VAPDPLFGPDEEVRRVARESIEHRLTWKFDPPLSREALLTLVERLQERLSGKGDITVEVTVQGELHGTR
ncbi:MAG: hypothetical protein ACK4WK_07450, partial [Anaerolineae bacterium]